MVLALLLVTSTVSSFWAANLALGQDLLAHVETQAGTAPAAKSQGERRVAATQPGRRGPADMQSSAATPPSQPVTTVETAIGSLVSSADRLSIKFQGHPTLSGDYRISGDETLTIPAVGRIKVTGHTLTSLEKTLNAEVLRLTGRETYATVEVLDYREVFVTGFVSKAGSFPWKRGMTVLHAETMSGGVYRPSGQNGSPLPADAEKSRARHAAADLARLLAQQARLNAEQSGSSALSATKRMRDLATDAEIEQIMAAERAVLKSHVSTFEAQIASLNRLKQAAREEVTALKGQRDRIEAQLRKHRDLQGKIESLAVRGVVNNDKVLAEQARILELEERAANVTYAVSRAEASGISADRDAEVLRLQQSAGIETERQRISRDIAQSEIEVESASSSFQKLTGQRALATAASPFAEPLLSYEIIRNEADQPRTIHADRSTALMPGDVVVVGVREGM